MHDDSPWLVRLYNGRRSQTRRFFLHRDPAMQMGHTRRLSSLLTADVPTPLSTLAPETAQT
jgi:hypothetical protein